MASSNYHLLNSLHFEVKRLNQKHRKVESQVVGAKIIETIQRKSLKNLAIEYSNGSRPSTLKSKIVAFYTVAEVLNKADEIGHPFARKHDIFYFFNGCYWETLAIEELKHILSASSIKLGFDVFEAKYYDSRTKAFLQFQSEVPVLPDSNCEHVQINLLNGTLHIADSHEYGIMLRDFDKNNGITYQLGYPYDRQAKYEKWQCFLDEVIPEKEAQMVLGEYLGVALGSRIKDVGKVEKALILYGAGSNGKSVIFEVLQGLLGNENLSAFDLESLTDKDGYTRIHLENKILNFCSEISPKADAQRTKQLISGEKIACRDLYKSPRELERYAKLMFNCNTLPQFKNESDAIIRRFMVIMMHKIIAEERQNDKLHKELIANEASGILNWIIEGLLRFIKQKRFTKSDHINMAGEMYHSELDSVGAFIKRHCIQSSTEINQLADIFNEYLEFCTEHELKQRDNRVLSKSLMIRGFKKGRNTSGTFFNLEMKNVSLK